MRNPLTILAAGFLITAILAVVPVSRFSQTCVYCHLKREQTTCLGLTSVTDHANACSRWYPSHVEPTHAHRWEQGTCRSRFSLLGFPMGVSCTNGRPILGLSATTQLGIYQHFQPPIAAKPLLARLQQETRNGDRAGSSQEREIVAALQAWEAAGWPGSWEDWWRGSAEPAPRFADSPSGRESR